MDQQAKASPRATTANVDKAAARRVDSDMQKQNTLTTVTPDYKLLGMAMLTMEMAETTLAQHDWDASQMLVELAMSVFYTATSLAPEANNAIQATRHRLETLTQKLHESMPNDECDEDPDALWSGRVV